MSLTARIDRTDTCHVTAAAVTTTKTVIVADDTAFVRDRFATALLGAGHTALTVKSAAELLVRVRSDLEHLDLIVLDLRLPHAQGVALVRAVRAIEGFTAPIVVFSGTIASADEVRELSTLGIAGYINEYSAVQHILPSLAPHLFPDNFNRRGSPRVVLGIPVAYRFGNTIAAALTLNLSKGGIAIRTMSPLQGESKVRARFRLPGSKRDIEAESRVAWSDRRAGMGLQFEKVDPADQAAIDEFVDQHFFSNRKA
jgi:two-component system chemotaxis response regulator CheY